MLPTVERQGRRLSHLISDFLLLTSLEQNSSPTPFKSCCLNDVISDLTEDYLELALIAELDRVSHIPKAEI
jgi:two-component system, OmpR family, Ni(II)-sensor and/or redox sensor kinase NrsS